MKLRSLSLATTFVLLGAVAAVALPALGEAEPGVVHFTATGDFGSEPETNTVLDLINTTDPDLNIALGDLSYRATGAEQAWCDRVTARVGAGFPFELLAGNHESNGLNGNINDFSACLPNQLPGLVGTYGRQFYVDVPQAAPLVRFVMIDADLDFPDGTHSYDPGTPRYNWTVAAIDSARAAGVPWIVVGIHKPCFSLGEYDCAIGAGLVNMLVAKKVDLVLHGHEHLYQRTHQLGLGPGCGALAAGTVVPACVVDADPAMRKDAGTVFATVGTGGRPLRPADPGDSEVGYFAAYSGQSGAPSFGVLDVRATADQLEARFLPTVAGVADAFTISRGTAPPNQPPTAAFTSTTSGLSAAFDGRASADPDGTITGYAWNFGDGTTGSGSTVTHPYAAAGTYPATLVVTDNGGLSATLSRSVTVAAPPGEPVAFVQDTFARTVTGGLGTADVGGPWTGSGTAAGYSVGGGAASIVVAAGQTRVAYLGATTRTDSDLRTRVAIDRAATGSGVYVDVLGRRISSVNDYRARVRFTSNGGVTVSLNALRGTSSVQTVASGITLPGFTYTPGQQLEVRFQVTGTNPTTLRLRVWPAGTPEPTTWLVTATDSTAGLQVAGSCGIAPYVSSGATNGPVTVGMSDLTARPTA